MLKRCGTCSVSERTSGVNLGKLTRAGRCRCRRRRHSFASGRAALSASGVRPAEARHRGEAVLIRVGSRGSRLALTQAELAAARAARGRASRSRSCRSRRRATATGRSRSARSARAASSSRSSRRRCSSGRIDVAVHSAKDMTSTDTDGLVGRRLPRARRSARRAVRRRRDPAGHADRHGVGPPQGAAARARADALDRAAARQHRHAAAQARRARARCGRARGVRARPARARGARSACGFDPEELLPEAGQGALALQVRAGDEHLVAAADTRRRGGASRPSARWSQLWAAAASRPSRRTTTAPR